MKIVVAAYGSRGDVEPAIAVGAELLRRGHDVRMATTVPPEMRAYVESAGLFSVPYGRDWQGPPRPQGFPPIVQNPGRPNPPPRQYRCPVVAGKHQTLVA